MSAAACRAPFEQPRFFRVDAEEHHQVSGPDLAQAAALFAAGEGGLAGLHVALVVSCRAMHVL